MSKSNNLTYGDLVMFQRPCVRWKLDEEFFVYGMIKKKYAPGTSWNKARRVKYDILSSDSRIWHEISEEKLIILSRGKKD